MTKGQRSHCCINKIAAFFGAAVQYLKNILYDVKSAVYRKAVPKVFKARNPLKRSTKKMIFYIIMVALPVLQFCIFYIGINANSILLAFRSFDYDKGQYVFNGLENFKQVIHNLKTVNFLAASIRNSFVLYIVNLLVGVSLALIFSFYIYKRCFLSGMFKVVLFLPSILSSVVLVTMFKYFVESAIPVIWEVLTGQTVQGLLGNMDTVFPVVLFFNVFAGFGVPILMYSGAMNGISQSVVESGKLDGMNTLQEFIYITIPLIYPTLVTFIVVGIAGIFVNQMHLYSFFGSGADYSLYTFGYYLFRAIRNNATIAEYPYLAAMGLLLTAVAAPLTLGIKYLLEMLGPKA